MTKHAVLVLKHFNYCTTVKNEHRMYLCSLISVRECLDTFIFLTQVKTKQKNVYFHKTKSDVTYS